MFSSVLLQTAVAEQGVTFAAAKIQGLARGRQARRVVSRIWRQAEAFALKVVRGEREASMKREAERKAKEKVSFLLLLLLLCFLFSCLNCYRLQIIGGL